MKILFKDIMLLSASIFSYFLFSLSFILMGIADPTTVDISVIIPGVMFWLFLIVGIVTQIILVMRRKKRIIKERIYIIENRKKIGIISFFQNYPALVADCLLISSLISIIFVFIYNPNGILGYVLIAICVFSFCMHCIFNGKVYNHIINRKKILFARYKKRETNRKGENEDVKGEE